MKDTEKEQVDYTDEEFEQYVDAMDKKQWNMYFTANAKSWLNISVIAIRHINWFLISLSLFLEETKPF